MSLVKTRKDRPKTRKRLARTVLTKEEVIQKMAFSFSPKNVDKISPKRVLLWSMRFPLLTLYNSRFGKLSDISSDIGLVFFASMFIGPMLSNEFNWAVMVFGLILSISAWFVSLLLVKE